MNSIFLDSPVNLMTIVIVVLPVVALLVYLIARNQKDKKNMIDKEDASVVEETKNDQFRDKDKL